MARFEAILFDFDGVLLDSERVHFACWAEVLKPLGLALDWQTYSRECIGISDREMLEMLARRSNPPQDVASLLARYPAKRDCFRNRMLRQELVTSDTASLIRALRPDYKLAVVSSSARCEVEPILELGGVRCLFDTVVCAEDVERPKPAPEPYLLAARRLGVRTALVVEDSDAGLESGKAAGFDVLRIPEPARTRELVERKLREEMGPPA